MARKISDSVIEKILENFEDSDLSDFENSESEEILEDLFEAFDNNETFMMEELSRQGPYDISITNINGECNDELVLDENGSSSEAGTSNYQPKQVNEFRWKKTSWAPPQAEFSECYSSNAVKLPVQYFLEYFTVEFFEEVVQATNQASLLKDGRSFNLTKEEFFKFLALEVMIGTIGYPRLSMYWTAPTDIPAFRQNMTKNRFHSLRNNLKFTTSDPGNDKLFRIRPLINIFTKKLYTIPKEENLCVDEMMVPFKRKTVLRQYMPKKPIKWGIKLFCLRSSNGMLYDFEIYQGKNTVISGAKLGFCSDIVVHLTRTIPENKNLKLFFDNYFSTLNLILYLQKKGIWATGTIRGNRCSKVPLQSEKELKKEGRGSFDYRIEREDNLYVIRWLDGGVVQLISSIYGEEPLKNVQRFLVEKKTKVEITQPYIVAVYNKNMGGVDKIDFLLSLYRISIRSRKWTLKIFDHFIDLAICNSWLEYRKDHEGNNKGQKQKHMDLLEFRNDIADGLLAQANKDAFSRKRGRPKVSLNENIDSPSTSRKRYETAPSVSVRYDGNQHWVEYTEKKNRCKLKGCSGFSRYKCSKCSVHLCLPNEDRDCFKDYHCSD